MSKRAASSVLSAAAGAIAAASAARQARASAPPPLVVATPDQELGVAMSAADRENPEKLAGQALRDLAHRRGIARSEAASMSDEKLRMQLRYITNRQYADEEA